MRESRSEAGRRASDVHADRQQRHRDAGSRSIWRRGFDADGMLLRAAAALPALRKTLVFGNEAPAQESNPSRLQDCANLAHTPAREDSGDRLRKILPWFLTNGPLVFQGLRQISAKLQGIYSNFRCRHSPYKYPPCLVKKTKKNNTRT